MNIMMGISMQEVLQDSSKSGNALKSIASNMAGVRTSLKDGSIESNKTARALLEIADIQVWDKQTGDIRDMYSVMDELSGKWDTLREDEKNALGSTIAGKTQLNAFNAMMSNWDKARQYMAEYKEGMTVGSAEKENLRILDSIEGKMNVLKENAKGLFSNLITSDLVKGGLDGVNKVVEGISTAVTSLSSKGMLGASIAGLATTLKLISSPALLSKGIFSGAFWSNAGAGVSLFGSELARTRSVTQAMSGTMTAMGTSTALATLKTKALAVGSVLLKGALVGLAVGGIIMAGKALYDYAHASEISAKQHRENIEGIQSELASRKQQVKGLREIATEYDTLSKKQDKTTEETERFIQLRRQVAELAPELVIGYDENNDPILKMTGSLSSYIAELDRAIARKERLMKSEQNQLARDELENIKKTQKEINDLQSSNDGMDTYAGFGDTRGNDWDKQRKQMLEHQAFLDKQNEKNYQTQVNKVEEYMQKEEAIRQGALNRMADSPGFKKLSDKQKESAEGLAGMLDWGNMEQGDINKLVGGISKLGNKVVSTTEEMGDMEGKINNVEDAFAKNGKMAQYTKDLTGIYESAQKFDTESLGNWMSDLNQYAQDTGNWGERNRSLDKMSETLHGITKLPKDLLRNALDFPLPETEAYNRAFSKFLNNYDSGMVQLSKGDGYAKQLQQQYETLGSFQEALLLTPTVEITPEFLDSYKGNLPAQVDEFVRGALEGGDGGVTEIEHQMMVAINTEILNGNTIEADTQAQIEKLFGGKLTSEEKEHMIEVGIKIGEKVFKGEEVEQLINEYEENPVEVDMEVNSEEAQRKADEIKKSLEELPPEVVSQIEMNGWNESQEKVDLVKQAIENVPEEKQAEFLMDCEDAINKSSTIEEFIKNMPDSKKLKYDMYIEGNPELEKAKANLEGMPEVVQSKVYAGVIGVDQIAHLKQMQEGLGDKNFNYIVEMSGGVEALAQCKTLEEALALVEGVRNGTIKINADGSTEVIEKINNELDETDGKESNPKVDVETTGVEEAEQAGKTIDDVPEKKDSELTVKTNIQELKGDIEAITSISAKAGDGSFNLTFTTNIGDSIGQINSLKGAIEGLSNVGNKSITFTCNTSQASKNITGLINNINRIPSGGKTITFTSNTAQASKNITGLINNANRVPSSKSMTFNANTAQASKNITGLINNANRVPSGKTLNYKANTAQASKNISGLIAKCNSVPGGKTITYNVVTRYSTQGSPTPASRGGGVSRASVTPRATPASANTPMLLSASAEPAVAPMSLTPMMARSPISTFANTPSETPMLLSAKARATDNISIDLGGGSILDSIKFNVELLQELQNRINKVSGSLDILDKKATKALGEEKIKFLREQNQLYEEQQRLQQDLISKLDTMKNTIQGELRGKGFGFTGDGNLTNYEEQLLAMERHYESLQEASEKASKAQSDYTGDDEATKNRLKKASEDASKAEKDYGENLSYTKSLLQEYISIVFSDIPNAQSKFEDLANSIADNNEEIKDMQEEVKKLAEQFKREKWELRLETDYTSVENDVKQITNELKSLETQMKNLEDEEKIPYLEKQIELYKQYKQELKEQLDYMVKVQDELKNTLASQGFSFDASGDITNLTSQMQYLKDSLGEEEFKRIQETVNGYLDLLLDKVPDIKNEFDDVNNSIKDTSDDIQDIYDKIKEEHEKTLKDNLDKTEKIEKQITDIYKKEIDTQIKKMKEATDKRIEELNKQKKAYNDMRAEQDYQDDFAEQQSIIDNLQKQIDKYSRDDSITGKKKLQELMKQLEEENKKLQDITQGKIDDTVNDMIDDEIDRVEKESEDAIKNLEELWSDEKIAQAVQNALKSGIFTNINGEMTVLKDKLLEFATSAGEEFSVMGESIKNELIDNLGIALDTLKNIVNINKELGLDKIEIINPNAYSSNGRTVNNSQTAKAVTIGDTYITIEHSDDKDLANEMREIAEEVNDKVLSEILKYM